MTLYNSSVLEESLDSSTTDETTTTTTYEVFEKGSKRGGKLLVSSAGYTYGVKV
ncbi:hypothetical protein DPMN_042567 [Dreissena polymorpha]|uniref:Uncharacterized protein n=1 Tax=Dreissena polymorpha TaxID=45954 RepID=A0A9D4CZB8_DREPO|nr:hypothetical protein DPMN_042562 [Dreissena polymorpha]KAH3736007.1 hypothetical protein DPMN_042567 [Dreissena polymorpha]